MAFKKFFSGDFAGAYDAVKNGVSQIWGVQSGINAVNDASKVSFGANYDRRLAEQKSMVIPTNSPTGKAESGLLVPGLSGAGSSTKTAESLGIGGTGGSGRGVTLTVHMTNNFNLSGEGDVKRIVQRVKEE